MIRQAVVQDAKQLTEVAYLVLEELYEPLAETKEQKEKQKQDLCALIQRDDVPMSFHHVTVFEEEEIILGALWSYEYSRFSEMLQNLYRLEKEKQVAIPHLVEEARVEDYYIDTVAVLPQARGKRVAQKLLNHIVTKQKDKNVALIVDQEKEIPVYLYKKLGFEVVEANEMYGSVYYYMHYQKSEK